MEQQESKTKQGGEKNLIDGSIGANKGDDDRSASLQSMQALLETLHPTNAAS